MRVTVDAAGVVVALGGDDLNPGEGQRTISHNGDAFAAYAAAEASVAGLSVVVYDETARRFVGRARSATPAEQERTDRDGLLAQIDAAITGWPSATNAAKLDAVLLCLKAIRAIARYVLRGA